MHAYLVSMLNACASFDMRACCAIYPVREITCVSLSSLLSVKGHEDILFIRMYILSIE